MANMLKNTNSKLGKSIYVFNLPAGISCPGKTEFCASICYAAKVERIYTNTKQAYARNLDRWLQDSIQWRLDMIQEINKTGAKVIRIHANGDFIDAAYINAWRMIAETFPKVQFFAYTRSWRVASLLPALEAFRALPNVSLLASVDPTTGAAPAGWRVASILDKAESKQAKKTGKAPRQGLVCLEQAGKAPTCDKCKVCFAPMSAPVLFIQH